MYVHYMHDCCLWRSEEGGRYPGNGVTHDELPCGSRELNPGPLCFCSQQVLLSADSPFQHPGY